MSLREANRTGKRQPGQLKNVPVFRKMMKMNWLLMRVSLVIIAVIDVGQ
jgi:hypothetical protein